MKRVIKNYVFETYNSLYLRKKNERDIIFLIFIDGGICFCFYLIHWLL